ncbi:MAG: GNAT family protein [Propionibacteriaceae bacterium]|nr:GNAT family protein [Propionibacteriaceae bacterium]
MVVPRTGTQESVSGHFVGPLHTDRLVLRHYRRDDVDALLAFHRDPSVVRYLRDEPWTRAHAEEQVAKRMGFRRIDGPQSRIALVVELQHAAIGVVALWPVDESISIGEVGWIFNPAHGGHGYATEAGRALLRLAFQHYGMHRVTAQLDPRNTASGKVCDRLGMTKEAHLRQDWWNKGEWSDTAVYGILRDEWVNGPAQPGSSATSQ